MRGYGTSHSIRLFAVHVACQHVPGRILSSYLLHLRLPDLPARQRVLDTVFYVSDQGRFGLLGVTRQRTL